MIRAVSRAVARRIIPRQTRDALLQIVPSWGAAASFGAELDKLIAKYRAAGLDEDVLMDEMAARLPIDLRHLDDLLAEVEGLCATPLPSVPTATPSGIKGPL